MPPTTADTNESPANPRLAGMLRRIGTSTGARLLVVAALVVVGTAGSGLANEPPAPDGEPLGSTATVVEVTCDGVTVTAPSDRTYYLHLTVRDDDTGQVFRALVGPFSGSLDERSDGAGVTITAAELLYEGGGGASDVRSQRC